jgi:hypothetical protein
MSSLGVVVRITTKSKAVWRSCARCDELAALADDEFWCPACVVAARPANRRPRAA